MAQQLPVLEHHVTSSTPVFSLGHQYVSPLPYPSTSELGAIKAQVLHLSQDHRDFQACLGHDAVDLGGVKFEYLPQTIAWVTTNLPSGSYYVFIEINTLLDDLGPSCLSDKDFIDEKYHTTRGRFENESAARVAASFGRERPTIFGKMDTSTTTSASSPLPAIKIIYHV